MTSNISKEKLNTTIKNQILNQGFLAVTLKNPSYIEPFEFSLSNGTAVSVLDTGVLLVESELSITSAAQIDIVLSSGIHGNETAPIEILNRIINEILSENITVQYRVLFIIGNPQAAIEEKRFIDVNLNRLFSYEENKITSLESKRAIKLIEYVERFFDSGYKNKNKKRIHYDLHTAIRGSLHRQFVIYPFQDEKAFDFSALAFFKRSKIKTILLSHQPSNTFSYFTSHNFNADAFTVELGSVKPFGENNLSEFEAIYIELIDLLDGYYQSSNEVNSADDFRIYKVKHELIKKSDQFHLNVEPGLHNFHQFEAGLALSNDIDGGYITAENDAIVFPNPNVPIGQRAGLIITQQK